MSLKRKRSAYDAAFKLKVVEFAEAHNNCAAEREFGVSEKNVRDWRKKKEELQMMPKTKKAKRTGKASHSALEEELMKWVTETRQNGYVVSRNSIRLKAMQLSKENYADSTTDFKASRGWCSRFLNRHGLTLRQRTHIAQKLPSDVEEKVSNFHTFIIGERKRFDFSLSCIGNMDETPMQFDMPMSRTIDFAGKKTVSIKTTGAEKSNFTVVLSCMADGTKLKPLVIFKRKTMPKEKLPSGLVVTVNPKGWVDEAVCLMWLEKVWGTRPGALLQKPALLVWDMFRAHLTEAVKKRLSQMKTRQAVIPGGTTSLLQPLDVCLNKPFKTNMRHMWGEWMINGDKELTAAGNLRRASIGTVCQWVLKAWADIPTDMVQRSFMKCGISNAMDGSEDDELFADRLRGREADDESTDDERDDGVYDDRLTEEQFRELVGYSDDDDDFEGFDESDI